MRELFLETKRLRLYLTSIEDFNLILALRSDPDVMAFLGPKQNKADVESFFAMALPYQQKHGFGFCSVFEKTSDKFIGQAGLFHVCFDDKQTEIEVGYRLHKQFWGKGYATELTRALLQWGFEHLSVEKLLAYAMTDNIASHRVLEKAGMIYQGNKKYRNADVRYYEIYKADLVELLEYDSSWPMRAKEEMQQLYSLLPENQIIDIQHVGSTSIPGMSAKPIIDIQIAVASLPAIKQSAITSLESVGYVYWSDNPDVERMFFVKGMPPFGEKRTHHVHIVEERSRHWREKIDFRDYLISQPETARAYKQLKQELARKYAYDRETYTEAKTAFVRDVLKRCQSLL